MTDLNPTPNDKLVISGIEGFGSIIAGGAIIVYGLVSDAAPLAWTGLGLIAAGGILAIATAVRRRRKNLTNPSDATDRDRSNTR
jgi:hypothetical protein